MSNKLIKEIITTTTERFGDSGSIKEKVTESREKIYETGFTEQQFMEAEVVENTSAQTQPRKKEVIDQELINQVASRVDRDALQEQPSQPQQQPQVQPQQRQTNPAQPYITPQQPAPVPQYTRAPMSPAQPQQTAFPWEK